MMKFLCTSLLCLFFSIHVFCQGHLISPKWKIKSFGISLGYDQDMLTGMDYTYFLSTIQEETRFKYSNLNLNREYVGSMICENPHLRLNLSLLPPGLKNTELNLALVGIAGRIDYVEYVSPNEANLEDPEFQYLSFDLTSDEIDLEASFLKRIPIGRAFNLYGGLGTNLGFTTRNHLYVNGQNILIEEDKVMGFSDIPELRDDSEETSFEPSYFSEYYHSKTAFSQRLFAQIGFSFAIVNRFEFGLEYRRGIGYRHVGGASTNTTHLQSVGLSTRWILR